MKNLKQTNYLIGLILIIISFFILITGCSSDYSKKLKGKIWAATDESYWGEYLWRFDSLGVMQNINFSSDSKADDAKYQYELNGNKISIIRKGKKREYTIDFRTDTNFILKSDKEQPNFRVANKQDSLVGNWQNINDNNKNFNSVEFHQDNDCEFSINTGEYFSTLFGGTYKINENEIELEGKEESVTGSGEKTFKDKFEIQILSLDKIKIMFRGKSDEFNRDKFKN